MKTAAALILATVLMVGCSTSGPVQLSPDTYMISRSSGAGAFTDMPALKAQTIKDANAFAAKQGKVAVSVSQNDVRPTFGFPSFDYTFKLVNQDAPEAKP